MASHRLNQELDALSNMQSRSCASICLETMNQLTKMSCTTCIEGSVAASEEIGQEAGSKLRKQQQNICHMHEGTQTTYDRLSSEWRRGGRMFLKSQRKKAMNTLQGPSQLQVWPGGKQQLG